MQRLFKAKLILWLNGIVLLLALAIWGVWRALPVRYSHLGALSGGITADRLALKRLAAQLEVYPNAEKYIVAWTYASPARVPSLSVNSITYVRADNVLEYRSGGNGAWQAWKYVTVGRITAIARDTDKNSLIGLQELPHYGACEVQYCQ